jgi:hypothetical protein
MPQIGLGGAIIPRCSTRRSPSGATCDIRKVAQQALARRQSDRPRHAEQIAATNAEIRKAEDGLERYFAAFESGSTPEKLCASRIESLSHKLAQLRNEHAELVAMAECEPDIRVTREHLGDLLGVVRSVSTEGHARAVKALLQALVVEIRVEGRNAIQPVFRVPAAVRILDRVVGRGGLEPVLSE